MTLIHQEEAFQDLLRITAQKRKLAPGLIEKDYWVTHTLWALHEAGFDVWFKGGTSLSKGFGLIERFSEDLDLKIEPGTFAELPAVSSWISENPGQMRARKAYFEKLAEVLVVPDAKVELDATASDKRWRSGELRVTYPGKLLADLPSAMAPFVRLEVGSARVTPFVSRDMSSFVHDELLALGQAGDFDDNLPRAVRCVHPFVTLLEKLDAIQRRFSSDRSTAATFVRHFEDAARIIHAASTLPPLAGHDHVRSLAGEMLAKKDIASQASSSAPAFQPRDDERWREVQNAHKAIHPMFWGERISLEDACRTIRTWIEATFVG